MVYWTENLETQSVDNACCMIVVKQFVLRIECVKNVKKVKRQKLNKKIYVFYLSTIND